MEHDMPIAPRSTKKRTVNIREADNGFILRCTVEDPTGNTSTERCMDRELVVLSLPQLLKVVRSFFEPEIIEG